MVRKNSKEKRKKKNDEEEDKPFRIHRMKVGLTYSCPTDGNPNPIESMEVLLKFLEGFGVCDYIIKRELHKNGEVHYHAWLKYTDTIDTVDVRFFDFCGVHPNIINPGKGWLAYCVKDEEGYETIYISNFFQRSPFHNACRKRTWAEASEELWEKEPKWMLERASIVEANFTKRAKGVAVARPYYGPHWNRFPEWDSSKHTLIVTGKAGTGKTQWAKYIAEHFGGYLYVKGKMERALKNYNNEKVIIFDDSTVPVQFDINDWNSLLDVENGGEMQFRHANASIPPGVIRIWLRNENGVMWGSDPDGALERRVFHVNY